MNVHFWCLSTMLWLLKCECFYSLLPRFRFSVSVHDLQKIKAGSAVSRGAARFARVKSLILTAARGGTAPPSTNERLGRGGSVTSTSTVV